MIWIVSAVDLCVRVHQYDAETDVSHYSGRGGGLAAAAHQQRRLHGCGCATDHA